MWSEFEHKEDRTMLFNGCISKYESLSFVSFDRMCNSIPEFLGIEIRSVRHVSFSFTLLRSRFRYNPSIRVHIPSSVGKVPIKSLFLLDSKQVSFVALSILVGDIRPVRQVPVLDPWWVWSLKFRMKVGLDRPWQRFILSNQWKLGISFAWEH